MECPKCKVKDPYYVRIDGNLNSDVYTCDKCHINFTSKQQNQISDLQKQLENAKEQVVYGFYEDEVPVYCKASEAMELCYPVTVEDCTGMVNKIKELRQELAELQKERDIICDQLMYTADQCDAYKEYVNLGHYDTLEKQLAEVRVEIERLKSSNLKSRLLGMCDATKAYSDEEFKKLEDKIIEQESENDALREKVERLREGLRKLQYYEIEDWCGNPEHYDANDEIHNMECIGCGAPKCGPCNPDCWLSALLEEKP